jgi:hypothetical protein
LRQVTRAILAADAYLFKPGDAINVQQGGDNGTPLQKDEPQATNPPNGAVIDYYLKTAATTPVTLEIIGSGGEVLHTFSTETGAEGPQAGGRGGRGGRGGGIPNVSALWRSTPEPFSTAAGMHRVVWNPIAPPPPSAGGRGGGGGRGNQGAPLTGTFTARLTVGGKSYSQSFTVKADPRSS